MKRMAHVAMTLVALTGVAWAQALPDEHPARDRPATPAAEGQVQEPEGDLPIESSVSVGDRAPDFALDGAQGRTVRLSDLKGRWAAVVFDEDRTKLGDFNGVNRDLSQLGVQLYGVCPDGSAALEAFAEREKLSYPLLSDPTREVSELYGMYDSENDAIQPGLVLLDPKGIVRAIWAGPSLHSQEIMQLVRHSVTGA